MVNVTITGTLDGFTVMSRRLQALEDRIKDVSPAAPAVFAVFRDLARQAFESEGATTDAGPWAPLAKSTEADRVRQGYPAAHPILQRSGVLYRSVAEKSGDTIEVANGNYMAIGSAVPYIVYHQSTAARTRIPRRPVVALTEDNKHVLLRPIRRYITGHDADAPVRRTIG